MSRSPKLQPGCRVRLYGGYDPEPEWLNGSLEHRGTLERFIPGQDTEPAAVVRLDAPITIDGVRGSIVVLELRYEGQQWSDNGTVHVELCDFDPVDKRWQDRQRGRWIESHASYELTT
jgi:hypothetical protein